MRSLPSRITISVGGGFDKVREIATRLRFGQNSPQEVRGTGSIGLHLEAGIFRLKDIGDVAMRGQSGVPNELSFFSRAALEHLFSIGATVVGEIGHRFGLRGGG